MSEILTNVRISDNTQKPEVFDKAIKRFINQIPLAYL